MSLKMCINVTDRLEYEQKVNLLFHIFVKAMTLLFECMSHKGIWAYVITKL